MRCIVVSLLSVCLLAALTGRAGAAQKPQPIFSWRADVVRPGEEFAIWSPDPFIQITEQQYPKFGLIDGAGKVYALSSDILGGSRGTWQDKQKGVFLRVPLDCPPGKYELVTSDKPSGFTVTVVEPLTPGPTVKISPGDGDDAQALNTLLGNLKEKNAIIQFSPGIYRWQSRVRLPPGVTLMSECLGPVHIVCSIPADEPYSMELTSATNGGRLRNLIFHGNPTGKQHVLIRTRFPCSSFDFDTCVFEDFSQVAAYVSGARYDRCRAIRSALVLDGALAINTDCQDINPRFHAFVVDGRKPSLLIQCRADGTDRGIILREKTDGTKLNTIFLRNIVGVANGCEGVLAEDANVNDVSIDHLILSNCAGPAVMVWCNDNNAALNLSGWRVNDVRSMGSTTFIWLRPNRQSWVTDMRFTNIEIDGWIQIDRGCQGVVFDGLIQRKNSSMENQTDVAAALVRKKHSPFFFQDNGTGTVIKNRLEE